MEEKLLIHKETLVRIQSRAMAIKFLSKDKQLTKEVEEILELIDKEIKANSMSLIEKIEHKMKETKLTNPEMNANLYILYRKLSDGKISETDASALFELYINTEPFDKKIY
ncbi:hypothetical protein BD780_002376 [Clostridium tetanomorphum]|uniref:Uncharacterized protein n=1 Tax=Clostridium tetanomorphum TaxID=1553 RepID=A0A923E5G6_CLOTT|nr:hypothetical protein [Clostridium tetanomorphum]KAJ51170.1 hypothetical protein CTM_14203 [Clostridium tetanomorphum DSM 665]MBC2396703.1 hypothetical protein [Clostridium tetanomorphum]MBP1866172.1 hypothetical protein [Clostridium tetanomorphum]NRS85151.1 hypothetical protein [Clostridium tetanomorphum]NRZ98332.1 hypothetical protein [Clostridium tetanomorphum]